MKTQLAVLAGLGLAVLVSALAVVYVEHRARTAFVELQALYRSAMSWMSNGGACNWNRVPGPPMAGSNRWPDSAWTCTSRHPMRS